MVSYHHLYQLEYDSTVWDPARALLPGHVQRLYQKRASFVLHQVAARTFRRPESFALDLARLRVDGGQAGFKLWEGGHAAIPRARRRSAGRSCTACPGLTCGIIFAERKHGKGGNVGGSAFVRGNETEKEQQASGAPWSR